VPVALQDRDVVRRLLAGSTGMSAISGSALDEHAWLAKRTKSPESRTSIREVADGIVLTAPEFRGAPPPRALDLLQKLEPNFKKV
jgi:hypothetical protein